MNAKELADVIDVVESISGQAELYGHEVAAERVCEAVEKLKKLIPRYRPPQPSDDGKWCFLEEFHDELPNLYKIVQHDDGSWWYASHPRIRRSPLAKGVWPCERPEGGVK